MNRVGGHVFDSRPENQFGGGHHLGMDAANLADRRWHVRRFGQAVLVQPPGADLIHVRVSMIYPPTR